MNPNPVWSPNFRSGGCALAPVGAAGAPMTITASWVDTSTVCDHLSMTPKTLRRLMASTPADIARPWVNIGHGVRATYRWRLAAVDAWFVEVDAHRLRSKPCPPRPRRNKVPTSTPSLRLMADEAAKGKR